MKVLLDTNIIILREVDDILNEEIGDLYYWIDKLKYDKYISPLTILEVEKYKDEKTVNTFKNKLKSYNKLPTISTPSPEFLTLLAAYTKNTQNDTNDNNILYELYIGRVDLLITEDKKLIKKASVLGLNDKIFNIESFLYKCINEHPELKNYKVLSIEKKRFGEINLEDSFFDSFKNDYDGFERWYKRKQDEEAYVCYKDNKLLGFLYIKSEDESEPYNDISPAFEKKKRLKIGTFKVLSSGFRLGERFLKIIFDNALLHKVDEIYVTLFQSRNELKGLSDLFSKWGFDSWGTKTTGSKVELVMVKQLNSYKTDKDPVYNFPNLVNNPNFFFMPIMQKFHTRLLPDAQLKNEKYILDDTACRYALQKNYITWAFDTKGAKAGDIVVFYRMGEKGNAGHTGVLTSIGVIQELNAKFLSKEDFLNKCQNRTVFSEKELIYFWEKYNSNLKLLKFIFIKEFKRKINLSWLWDKNIINYPNGPRPFDKIKKEEYNKIIEVAGS